MSKMMKGLVGLAVVTTLVSCGKTIPEGNATFDGSNIIVGEINWGEITDLSSTNEKRIAGKAVADIEFANGGRCTGFLISNNVLMTNEHCIGSAADVVGMKVFMKHEKGVSRNNQEEIKCSTFIGNDPALDFALVRCEGTPGLKYGKVELAEVVPAVGTEIYVVHQNCDYYTVRDCDWSKKVSPGKVVQVSDDIYYDADTLGGSSGSPLFAAATNKVIAIHHFGHGGGWTGRGDNNSGVPMTKIVPFIKSHFPGILDADEPTPTPVPTPVFSDDNQSYATASVLEDEVKVSGLSVGSEKDVDMYKVEMKAGEVLDFKIKFDHSEGDLDFKVYKQYASGKKLVKTVESATDDESVRLRVSSSTAYYVKVFGYKGAKAKYDLEFSKK